MQDKFDRMRGRDGKRTSQLFIDAMNKTKKIIGRQHLKGLNNRKIFKVLALTNEYCHIVSRPVYYNKK